MESYIKGDKNNSVEQLPQKRNKHTKMLHCKIDQMENKRWLMSVLQLQMSLMILRRSIENVICYLANNRAHQRKLSHGMWEAVIS